MQCNIIKETTSLNVIAANVIKSLVNDSDTIPNFFFNINIGTNINDDNI